MLWRHWDSQIKQQKACRCQRGDTQTRIWTACVLTLCYRSQDKWRYSQARAAGASPPQGELGKMDTSQCPAGRLREKKTPRTPVTFLFHNSGIKIAKKKIPRNGNADGKWNKLNLFFLSFLSEKVLTELIALRAMSPERKKKKIGVVVMTKNIIRIKYTDFFHTRCIYIERRGNSSCSL